MAADANGPLAGLTVIELAHIMAGPAAGMLLADLGAEVIKVERIPGGDDSRSFATVDIEGESPTFMMMNRNKRGIAVDLKTEGGKKVLRRLLKTADVVIENYRRGTMERLGLGYDRLKEANPGLVYCEISGFGRTGPYADRGGFDLIAQGMRGLMSSTGEGPDRPPVKAGAPITDITAGILAALGVVAALLERLAVATGVAYALSTSGTGERRRGRTPVAAAGIAPGTVRRIFAVLVMATLCGGVIFNATTISLPKVFDDRLSDLAGTTTGIGGLVTGVFMIAAVAQIVVGHLIDRYPLKRIFVGVAMLQVPMMTLAVFASDYAMLAVATGVMLLVFSAIPIYDTIIARYAAGHWRSRIYALKYTVGLGVAAGTVPLIAWVRDETGGFDAVFWILAALAVGVVVSALAFPSVARPGAGELGRRPDTVPAQPS